MGLVYLVDKVSEAIAMPVVVPQLEYLQIWKGKTINETGRTF